MDHNTWMTVWDDPRLLSTVDTDVLQCKSDLPRKIIHFRSRRLCSQPHRILPSVP
ncbi:hypothetical protein BJY52DRAFT_1290815 [Lactarius psammicola]|nr:hypothetical protein BJY52DRAFT_1290815 [Lactarius psammicola]